MGYFFTYCWGLIFFRVGLRYFQGVENFSGVEKFSGVVEKFSWGG